MGCLFEILKLLQLKKVRRVNQIKTNSELAHFQKLLITEVTITHVLGHDEWLYPVCDALRPVRGQVVQRGTIQ